MLGYLTRDQMLAVIDVPTDNWIGQRDRLLLHLLYNTGARVSEISMVRVADVVSGNAPCVHLQGKGRKQRSVPLWKSTAKDIRAWLHLNDHLKSDSPLLPTHDGRHMTRANVAQRLKIAVNRATSGNLELAKMSVTPHTFRHSTAMHLLQSGVDVNVIALWLGHESPSTTHMYIEADLAMKEKALSRLKGPEIKHARYCPPEGLMHFLQAL